jgi:glycosyltransferase involved in cell wall biosynthesis
MGRAGRERAVAEFDWANIAAATAGLYRELTGLAAPQLQQVKIHRD